MARPTVIHDGFLVPNAAAVSHPRMAEPDQVDFNIGAHALWGVIEGCLVVVAGSTATTTGGTVIIDGVMIPLAASEAQIGVAGAQDRFDLLVADIAGVLRVIPGAPAIDPVFPDPDLDCTVLAAVFCPAGATSFTDEVIDKRKFIHKALLTKIGPTDPLIRNQNGAGDHFSVRGDGQAKWAEDTLLYRQGPETLRIQNNLIVTDDLTAGNVGIIGDLQAEGEVTAANWLRTPSGSMPDAAASLNGAVLQGEDNGRVYVNQNGSWEELATMSSALPVGTIITSLQPSALMRSLGWIALNGSVLNESDPDSSTALFELLVSLGFTPSGITPNRSLTLPDARDRILRGSSTIPVAQTGGVNQVTLTVGQMPRHKHNTVIRDGGGGSPTARTSRNGVHGHVVSGGEHSHPVVDPGHAHNGADFFGTPSPLVALMWGGRNKVDALFNDRNHTYSVEAMDWITPALTNISIGSSGSGHPHVISNEGDHDHVVAVDPIPAHTHDAQETEMGNNEPVSIVPAFLVVNTYVRS